MNLPIDWDDLWIKMTDLVKSRSKDPKTQVGAVLVSPDNRKISIGYNGFLYGVKDTEERWERPTKYDYVCHAEMNAIVQASTDLVGWTAYTTIPICSVCARYIIQAGIKKVVYKNEPKKESQIDYAHAFALFREAGVEVIHWEG